MFTLPTTDKEDPSLAKDLSDKELPASIISKIDI
jgi:hypothetical protein